MKTPIINRLFVLFLLLAAGARAADRVAAIAVPPEIPPGGEARIVLTASTDFAGEKVGFLHSEFSTDGGKTWRSLCFLDNADASVERRMAVTGGPAGSIIVVRLRVAFRGGRAGDVDYRGKAIDWEGTWSEWRSPPTRFATIYVR